MDVLGEFQDQRRLATRRHVGLSTDARVVQDLVHEFQGARLVAALRPCLLLEELVAALQPADQFVSDDFFRVFATELQAHE